MAKGWLDNYGTKENENNSSVSLPEGFVGMGNNTKGRNYSPAWGGQFQEGGEIPMAQDGRATRADSLAVYNNAKKVEDYYKKSEKYKQLVNTTGIFPGVFKDNDEAVKLFNKFNKIGTVVPLKSGKKGVIKIPESIYRKDIDKNKYLQREFESGMLDTRSPIQLFDKRITPTMKSNYINTKAGDVLINDVVGLMGYDPLSVMPFDILQKEHPELITERIKKYGTNGIPKSYLNKNKQQPIQAIENNIKPIEIQNDFNLEAPLPQIRQQVRQPKYYDVEDYTQGSANYIGNQTNYRTSDLSTLSEQSPNNKRKITPHYQMGGSVYPVNYVPQAQTGGSFPGATGFSYARTGSIPSKGPHRNKVDVTDASAQNGKEMQYYQNGLDFKPKSISKNGSWLSKYEGEVIKDDRGQWDHPGEITEIGSNEITMQGVPYDVIGISDTGDTKLMKPGKNYKFKGKKVTEYPMAQNGLRQEQKSLQNLDNLTNFTNYNKPQPGSWLEKYN